MSEEILARRVKLPDTRPSVVHRFTVGGHKGYIRVGLYENGTPGEMFINMSKEGSTIRGLLDCLGIVVSLSLQNGVTLERLINKLQGQRFEPCGFTDNSKIKESLSVVDYIFTWMDQNFPNGRYIGPQTYQDVQNYRGQCEDI
jgi:ribonucleoside-diphosphate reductase alpha chain